MKPPASGSKLRYCGSCNAKAYCTKRCAQADWAEHKLVCEALRKTRDTAVGAFEASGGKKEEFNESNRVKKAWFASVPGLTHEIMLMAWNHRSESPSIHVTCDAGDIRSNNGSGVKVEVLPRSVWDAPGFLDSYPLFYRDDLRKKSSEAARVDGYPNNTAQVAQIVRASDSVPGHGASMNTFTWTFTQGVIRAPAIVEALTSSTRQQDLADAITWFANSNPLQGSSNIDTQLQYVQHRIRNIHGITMTPDGHGEQVLFPTRAINVEVAYMIMRVLNLEFDVKLEGLVGAAHLNGKQGVVCGEDLPNLERWKVLLDDTTYVSVKSVNFVHVRRGEYRRTKLRQ